MPIVPLVVIPMDEFAKNETDSDKKQFLGNYLFQFVTRRISETDAAQAESLAGKVTGMILEG